MWKKLKKNETEEAIKPDVAPQEDIDLGIDDDAIPNVSEVMDDSEEEEKQLGQGSYFIKEAGVHKQSKIKVDIGSIKPVEKNINISKAPIEEPVAKSEPAFGSEAQARGENEKLSFYDDL